MLQFPKISIITPSFNQGKFLEETIKSVISQNYPNLDYIIIDGGSKDDSIDIINRYSKYLSYFKSESDKGQAEAINKGMKRAQGDIVAYLNSDDCYKEGTLKFVAEVFSQNPGLDFIYGDSELIDEHGEKIGVHKEIDFDFIMGSFFGFGPIIPQPSAFWKSKIFKEVGYFNEDLDYNLDGDFFSRAVKNRNVKHYPIILSKNRFHDRSKTVQNINAPTSKYLNEHLNEVISSYSNLKISRIIPFKYSKAVRWLYRSKRIFTRLLKGHYFRDYEYRHLKI